MRIEWLKQDGNPRLAVIVLGWAGGIEQVAHLGAEGYDIVCIYDYRDFGQALKGDAALLAAILASYEYRVLIAWSFGVWAAERLFGKKGPCPALFQKSTALNGTPFPADEEKGIGHRRLSVTMRGMAKGGKDAFNRKMYGSWYGSFPDEHSEQTVRDNIQELRTLIDLSSEEYIPSIDWTSAVIGTGDSIFPPENMLRYWAGRAKSVPLPHYPFGDPTITQELF